MNWAARGWSRRFSASASVPCSAISSAHLTTSPTAATPPLTVTRSHKACFIIVNSAPRTTWNPASTPASQDRSPGTRLVAGFHTRRLQQFRIYETRCSDFAPGTTRRTHVNSIVEKFYSMEYGPAPEATAEVDAWLAAHDRAFGLYINGAWTNPANTVASINPATGEKIADVSSATAADMNAAVAAARAALPGWQALTGHQRARYLYALARQVLKHSRRLAVLESMDNGKPIRESRDIDIPLVARHFYSHAGWAQLLET